MLRLTTLLLLVAGCLASGCSDIDVRGARGNTKLNIKVISSGAKFKLYPNGRDDEKNKFVMFEFDDLEESDESKKYSSISSLCMNSVLEFVELNGVNTTHASLWASNVPLSGRQSPRLGFIGFDIWFVEQPTRFESGDEVVAAPTASMKFSVNISGWPFTNSSNSLWLDLDIKAAKDKALKKDASSKKRKYGVGDASAGGFIEFADTALIDDVSTPINITVLRNDDKRRQLRLIFPNFASNAYYDPVTALESTSDSFPGYAYALVALGVIAVIGGFVGFMWRRKKDKQPQDHYEFLRHPE